MNLSINQKLTIGALTISTVVGTGFFLGSYASSAEVRKHIQGKEIDYQKTLILEKDNVINTMLTYVDQLKLKKDTTIKSVESDDRKCMALTAFWEAGNHGRNMETVKTDVYAIASTVANRVKSRRLSVCDVTYEKNAKGNWEYSWRAFPSKHPNSEDMAKKINPEKWKYAVQIAEGLLSGKIQPIENIEFYNNPHSSNNNWHTDNVKKGIWFTLFSVGVDKKGNSEFHQFYIEKGKNSTIKQAVNLEILNKMKGLMK
jgi:spore germination cell wall hydrolase CwlJ-like protein